MTVRNFTVSTEPGVQTGLFDVFFRGRVLAVIALFVVSCASPAPPLVAPPPAPQPTPPPATPVVPAAPTRWSIANAVSPAGFTMESRAEFATRADTLARSDTALSRTTLRVIPRGAAI